MSDMRRVGDRPGPLVQAWLDWLDAACTVKGHNPHVRHECRESRERALLGVMVLDDPTD